MTLGALTLMTTLPLSSPALTAATSNRLPTVIGAPAAPLVGYVGITPVVVVTFGVVVVGVVAVDGTLGVVILGVEGNDGTELEGLEVVNDGLDIVLTFGRIGIAL
jgi:hypothetical protein